MLAVLEAEGRQHRHQRQRQQQRRRQREDDGERDRREQFSLQPLQRQQRHEHQRDDDDAGGDRHGDFTGRGQQPAAGRFAQGFRLAQAFDGVFNHHNGTIDEHADGHGKTAQAHQIGGKTKAAH